LVLFLPRADQVALLAIDPTKVMPQQRLVAPIAKAAIAIAGLFKMPASGCEFALALLDVAQIVSGDDG
jgi:hypothetical protein